MKLITNNISFQAIELKGDILPPSLLEDIAKLDSSKNLFIDNKNYDLKNNERIRDQIDSAWILCNELWKEFKNLKLYSNLELSGLHFAKRFLSEILYWENIEGVNGWQSEQSIFPITHRAFLGKVPLILEGMESNSIDIGKEKYGSGGSKRSPQSCLQDCLNADEKSSWGIIFSGEQIRLIHKNPSLVRASYLNIDLDHIIEDKRIHEFSILWLLLHSSRFKTDQDDICILDKWKKKGEKSGERVLGDLRKGVKNALLLIANGLLNHPSNKELKNSLFETKNLTVSNFHEQLLQLIYRFLFLLTIEDRNMLFPNSIEKNDVRRRIYKEGYSLSMLRELCIKQSFSEGNFEDIWQIIKIVFNELRNEDSIIGIPGLGGLFAFEKCKDIEDCYLSNEIILNAIKEIGWFRSNDSGLLTRVRYRDLNTEELGSIYEGLLELHPQIIKSGNNVTFIYENINSSDRKITSSYYTHDSLVQELIKTSLLPIIEERLNKSNNQSDKEKAILDIKVIDPSCGSGHFLLASARHLANNLARIRTNNQPSESEKQHALRDVVAKCIYGVDKNPMAVELCKVALWMEAIEPGKPLNFLDNHILCGDSLLGVFRKSNLSKYISNNAYNPCTNDNKTVCTSLKKENISICNLMKKKGGIKGMQRSLNFTTAQNKNDLDNSLNEIEAMPETTISELQKKQKAYSKWIISKREDPESLAAELITATYFIDKTSEKRAIIPTSEHLIRLLEDDFINAEMESEIKKLSKEYRFFHWDLRFKEIFKNGGFDCVIGNPPWDVSQFSELEFFEIYSPEIAKLKGTKRKEEILKLKLNNPYLWEKFQSKKREIECKNNFYKGGRYIFSSLGKINLYQLFAELFLKLIKQNGRAGIIVPTGIATDEGSKTYFHEISKNQKIISLYDFENRKGLFPDIHRMTKFSLLNLGNNPKHTDFAFFINDVSQLSNQNKHFELTSNDIEIINPNTKTCPIFRSKKDAEIIKNIYKRIPILINDSFGKNGNKWELILKQGLFNMTSDSNLFFKESSTTSLPLYEAKLIHIFDHRWSSFENEKTFYDVSEEKKQNPNFNISPRYWVDKKEVQERLKAIKWERNWLMGWRNITSPTNERTVISSVIPISGVGHSMPIFFSKKEIDYLCCFFGNWQSLVLDFIARSKIGGTNLTFSYLKQLPFLPPESYDPNSINFIKPKIIELTYTNYELKSWAEDLGYYGNPFSFNQERRAILRAELDAFYAYLYGLSRDELRFVLDPSDLMGEDYPSETFRVLKKNETSKYGEYLTKRLVLEAWDKFFDMK